MPEVTKKPQWVSHTHVHGLSYPCTRVSIPTYTGTDDQHVGYGGPRRRVRMTDVAGHICPTPWAKLGKTIGDPKYHPINKLAEV